MPWGDATGPLGMGPLTGRAAGYCAGFNMPGFANPVPRGGFGFGRGRGRGFGRGLGFRRGFGWGCMPYQAFGPPPAYYPAQNPYLAFGSQPGYYPAQNPYAQISTEQERQMLQNEAQYLRDSLSNIEQRLQELEKKEDKTRD